MRLLLRLSLWGPSYANHALLRLEDGGLLELEGDAAVSRFRFLRIS